MDIQGWVPRDALVRKIDAATGLVVVNAEGGAGKTVLVSEWLRTMGPGAALQGWVTFDEHDGNSTVAWRKFLGVLRTNAGPDYGKLSDDFENGLLSDSALVDILISVLITHPRPVIVLDDLHLASENFQSQLIRMVRPLPHLKVIITSRRTTLLQREATKLSLPVTLVTSQDLTFSFEETEGMIRSFSPGIPFEAMQTVYRATAGHALSTRVAATHFHSFRSHRQTGHFPQEAFTQLVELLPNHLPAFANGDDEKLATRIAFCPLVTPELASVLFGETETHEEVWNRVKHFETLGLGRIELRSGVSTFTFHALIKASLRAEFLKHQPEADVRPIFATAFRMLQGIADVVDVFGLGLDADLRDDFFPFFASNFSELSLHRTQECLPLLRRYTERGAEFSWQIALCYAVLSSETPAMSPATSLSLARQSLEALEAAPQPTHSSQITLHALAHMTAYRVLREYEQAADHATHLLSMLNAQLDGGRADEIEMWRPVIMQAFVTNVLAGRLREALDIVPLLEGDRLTSRYHHLLSHLTFIHAFQGDYAQATQIWHQITESDRIPNWDKLILSVGWKIGDAILTANQTDPITGLARMNELVPDLEATEMWPAVIYTRAKLRLFAGQGRIGVSELESTMHRLRERYLSEWWRERLEVCRAELLLASGRSREAEQLLWGCGSAPDVLVVLALTQLPLGNLAGALRHLDEALSSPRISVQDAVSALMLRAITERHLHHTDHAGDEIHAAIELAQKYENRLVFGYVPRQAIEQLSASGELPASLVPEISPFEFQAAEHALSKRELQVLDRLSDDATIEQTASDLYISLNTMKTHLKNIYRKLPANGRRDAIAKYREFYGK